MHSQGNLPEYRLGMNALPYDMAAIEAMDLQIGRLLASMTPQGRENTTIIFIGDNGTPCDVMIMTEMVHDARIIRIGDGPRLPLNIRPWFGDSWGRWERDALVVETTNINPQQGLRGAPPSIGTHEGDRALHSGRRRDDPLRVHRPRSNDVHAYLGREGPDQEIARQALRIRLSGGQLRARGRFERRALSGENGSARIE
jgi:hypothetical protein